VASGELDRVDDSVASGVESAEHTVTAQHADAVGVELEGPDNVGEGLAVVSVLLKSLSTVFGEPTGSSCVAIATRKVALADKSNKIFIKETSNEI
jgi:hypothetical protein